MKHTRAWWGKISRNGKKFRKYVFYIKRIESYLTTDRNRNK